MNCRRNQGFTIVELLIVIVIIAILAALVIVAYNGIQERAKASAAASDLKQIVKVLNAYYVDNSTYPCFDHAWDDTAEKNWSKTYGLKWPKNPWGNQYHFEHGVGFSYSISINSPGQNGTQTLDSSADDGNLTTGSIRGNSSRLEYAVGIDQTAPSTHCDL